MDARRAVTGDGERHRLIIFALMDPQVRAWPEAEVHKKFEKVRVLFVYAHHLVRMADLGFRKTHGAMFAAKLLHASEEWNAVRAAAVAAETFEQKADNFRRDSVLEALGLFVSPRPFEADYVGKKFFRETMAQDKVLGDFSALGRKLNVAAAMDAKIAATSHTFKCGGDCRRSDA